MPLTLTSRSLTGLALTGALATLATTAALLAATLAALAALAAAGGVTTRIGTPSRRPVWPTTTTCSPCATPLRISDDLSSVMPSCTGRWLALDRCR